MAYSRFRSQKNDIFQVQKLVRMTSSRFRRHQKNDIFQGHLRHHQGFLIQDILQVSKHSGFNVSKEDTSSWSRNKRHLLGLETGDISRFRNTKNFPDLETRATFQVQDHERLYRCNNMSPLFQVQKHRTYTKFGNMSHIPSLENRDIFQVQKLEIDPG